MARRCRCVDETDLIPLRRRAPRLVPVWSSTDMVFEDEKMFCGGMVIVVKSYSAKELSYLCHVSLVQSIE